MMKQNLFCKILNDAEFMANNNYHKKGNIAGVIFFVSNTFFNILMGMSVTTDVHIRPYYKNM